MIKYKATYHVNYGVKGASPLARGAEGGTERPPSVFSIARN